MGCNDDTNSHAGESQPGEDTSRRRFLNRLILGATGLATAIAAVPFIGHLVWPLRRPARREWKPVGAVESFRLGETVKVVYPDVEQLPWSGRAAEQAAWLRRTGATEFEAFSVYCTHVGCPVRWEAGAELFMCPCHGGAFYNDGTVASGPPPAPLPRYPVRIRDGTVEVLAGPIPLAGEGAVEELEAPDLGGAGGITPPTPPGTTPR